MSFAKLSRRAVLWAAFAVMHGGCSDDSFDYYRYELIAAGRKAFDDVVRDAGRLAEPVFAEFYGYPDIRYAARKAHEHVSGVEVLALIGKYKPFDLDAKYGRLGLDPN